MSPRPAVMRRCLRITFKNHLFATKIEKITKKLEQCNSKFKQTNSYKIIMFLLEMLFNPLVTDQLYLVSMAKISI